MCKYDGIYLRSYVGILPMITYGHFLSFFYHIHMWIIPYRDHIYMYMCVFLACSPFHLLIVVSLHPYVLWFYNKRLATTATLTTCTI